MELKKIISIVIIGVGIALLIYGMSHMDSASSQIGELFGKSDDKGMISIVVGGIVSLVGLFFLFSKRS